MSLPLRSIVALGVVAVLAVLIAGIVARLLWSTPRSTWARAGLVGAVLVLAAMALWIVFILPAYWD